MAYLKLIRVHQWVKNLFIFFPAFFGGLLFSGEGYVELLLAFFSFSMMASCVYIINDYIDREKDKIHPEKCNRPLASGAIKPISAFVVLGIFITSALLIAFYLGWWYMGILVGYFVMNLFYSFKLKHVPILDITIISIGFILRVFAGAVILDIVVSKWLIVVTFLGAMLLALAKRRDDLVLMTKGSGELRKSLKGYSIEFINAAMVVMASVSIVAYLMYTVSDEVVERFDNEYLYLTSFFMVLGVLRYLQLTIIENKSGSPTKVLLKDITIQVLTISWFITFGVLLYVA